MKKGIYVLTILVLLVTVFLLACSHTETIICGNCSTANPNSNRYCYNCGTAFFQNMAQIPSPPASATHSELSDSEKIVGTWQHTDSSWGLMEYTFYSDGSCRGAYIGKFNANRGKYTTVGGVNPALYPDSYYDGSGNGFWSFVDNVLRIEYIGEEQGIMYHNYYFSEDNLELTIEGKGKYSSKQGTAIWKKVN